MEWKAVNDRFTGIYGEGTTEAILRLSSTANLTEDSTGLTPALAIKFLIDGHQSENIFGMPNFDGLYLDEETGEDYRSWNFFEGTFRNRVEPFKTFCEKRSVQAKMLEKNARPLGTSISIPAYYVNKKFLHDETPLPIGKPDTLQVEMEDRDKYQFPYELQFEGVHDFPDDRDDEWYDRLRWHFNEQCNADSEGHCANGVKIYDVYAWTAPFGHTDLNGEERERIKIAEINLTTKLYTSLAGDERLFF